MVNLWKLCAVAFVASRVFRPEFPSVSLLKNPERACPVYSETGFSSLSCLEVTDAVVKFSECPAELVCNWSLNSPKATTCSQRQGPLVSLLATASESNNSTCSQFSPCGPGFFCSYPDSSSISGTCTAQVSSTCSSLDHCSSGLICNFGKCISQFSLPTGSASENRIACSSGLLKNKICSASITTMSSDLPKSCSSAHDCTASDGVTTSQCVCAGNLGKYCKLHSSDQLSLDFLRASFEGRFHDAAQLYQRLNLYPLLDLVNELDEYQKTALEFQALNT